MVIGLAGKSCSGKNHVGKLLEENGLLVWDLDSVCHDLLDDLTGELRDAFGEGVVSAVNGKPKADRAAISRMVFNDPGKRTTLEGLLYPRLRSMVEQWEKVNSGSTLVINGALLYRSPLLDLCSGVIYVDAPYEERLRRAMARDGISKADFDRREDAQTDVDYRVVDYGEPLFIVRNNEDNLGEVSRQVSDICARLNTMSGNCD